MVGSINADLYVEIDRLPKPGETMAAGGGETLPGGKGANQAACAGKLRYPTYFIGQVRTSREVEFENQAGAISQRWSWSVLWVGRFMMPGV